MREAIDESENPVVSSVRGAAYGVSSWLFDETETARVTRMMRAMDPFFEREAFERELREYIIPEVVDAYLSADREALKKWCGEAVSRPLLIQTSSDLTWSRRTMSYGQPWNNT